jgi:multiple sugar transport system substrate-binding protein
MDKSVSLLAQPVTKDELLRIIDFSERFRACARQWPFSSETDPIWRITLFLMRRYLEGRLVTVTSLAAASGVPYATAMRRIDDMFSEGLIVRRPRTRTGKSFSIYPSERLINEIHSYALKIKHLVGATIGVKERSGDFEGFYFGASYLAGSIIPAPSVMPRGIGLRHKLRLLALTSTTSRAMQSALRDIEQTLGGEVQITAAGIDDLLTQTYINAGQRVSDYDILTIDLPWIAEFVERGFLLALDELLAASRFNKDDFHPAGWEAARYHDVQYGVPIAITPELFMYRTDLFAEAEFSPVLTTDHVLQAARHFHRPDKGRYGIAWNGQRGTPMGQTFVHVLASFGRPPLALRPVGDSFDTSSVTGDEMRPTVDTREGLLTAEYLAELLAVSCPGLLEMGWEERVRLYRRGEVALLYEWSIRSGAFEMDSSSPAKDHTAYLPLPRGPGVQRHISPIGGLILCIPANIAADRLDLAWRSIEWLSSPAMMKLFIQHGSAVSPRFSVSADPEVRATCPIIAIVDQMEKLGQLQRWPRPPVPAYSQCLAILGEEAHDFMLGNIKAEPMLRRAQARIDVVMRERGYY